MWGGCCPKERMCSDTRPFCCPAGTSCFNGVCKDTKTFAWLASCAPEQLVRGVMRCNAGTWTEDRAVHKLRLRTGAHCAGSHIGAHRCFATELHTTHT